MHNDQRQKKIYQFFYIYSICFIFHFFFHSISLYVIIGNFQIKKKPIIHLHLFRCACLSLCVCVSILLTNIHYPKKKKKQMSSMNAKLTATNMIKKNVKMFGQFLMMIIYEMFCVVKTKNTRIFLFVLCMFDDERHAMITQKKVIFFLFFIIEKFIHQKCLA